MDIQDSLLLLASRLFSYPEESDREEDFDAFVDEYVEDGQIKKEFKTAYRPLVHLPLQVRQKLYVETFDMRAKTGLYLTAHELGDSPKRGAGLLKLKNTFREFGYDHVDGELADYIPLLFEFLAVTEKTEQHARLTRRLAAALKRIDQHIDANSYKQILQLLIKYVFPVPDEEEMKRLEFEREEADLEEMPYPIMYQ